MPAPGALSHFPHAPHSSLTAPSASPTRPPRQGTPDLSSVSSIRVFAASVSSSLGSPPLTQRPQVGAATGMPWGRDAAGRYVTSNNQYNDMKAKEGASAQDFRYVELAPRSVLPLIEETTQAIEQLQDIKAARKEHFVGLYLNARHELIHKEIVSIGKVNASIIHPRDVFSIMHNAAAVIVAHNHPSGDATHRPRIGT